MKRLNFSGIIFVIVCGLFSLYFTTLTVKEMITTYKLSIELKELSEENIALKEERVELEEEVKKYNNEDFLLTIARSRYYMTKGDGSQVFVLDNKTDEASETEDISKQESDNPFLKEEK